MISQAIVESKPGKKLIRYFPRPELSGPYYELSLGIDSQALYYIDPSKPQKTAILQPHVEWQQESLRRDIVEHFIRSGLDMHSETNDLADAILEALKRGPAPCTSVDTALSRLATGARYTSPNRVMFQQCDGPYRRLHLFDQVLGRDVAYCEEYHHFAETAWSRSKFLKEAQIGALRHPCLVPVLDFGQTKDGRFYFTQPLLLGESLASVVDDCLSNEGRRILYSGLKEAALPPMGMEDRESWENACLERRRRLEQQGFARWVERPAARRPRLGCHADVKAIYSELEECISKFERRKPGQDDRNFFQTLFENRRYERGLTFQLLSKSILDHYHLSYIRLASLGEHAVYLRLDRFVELILSACDTLAFVNRCGVWQSRADELGERIVIDQENAHIYLTDWSDAYVQGGDVPYHLRYDLETKNAHDIGRSLASLEIDGIARVLLWILHEPEVGAKNPISTTGRFREEIVPNDSPGWNEVRDFARQVESLCQNASKRFSSVEDFAGVLRERLSQFRRSGYDYSASGEKKILAFESLGNHVAEAVPTLEKLLLDEGPASVEAAIAIWKIEGRVAGTAQVLAASIQRFPTEAQKAAACIREMGPDAKEVIPFLIHLLEQEGNSMQRTHACIALGGMGFEATPAISGLVAALADVNLEVRESAMTALSELRSLAVMGELILFTSLLSF